MADSRLYNTRITDENLERKFRETFKSQAGAELVNDLFASGVILPTVDFTDAATGSVLRQDLQTAVNVGGNTFSVVNNSTRTDIITTTGFWQIDGVYNADSSTSTRGRLRVDTGIGNETIYDNEVLGVFATPINKFVYFVRPGETVYVTAETNCTMRITYRQIADLYGNLVNPTGFTSQ